MSPSFLTFFNQRKIERATSFLSGLVLHAQCLDQFNFVHIKSSPKPVSRKHVLQPPQSWLQFYIQLACTIAGQTFSLNETIPSTHTTLLRLASDILSVQLSTM